MTKFPAKAPEKLLCTFQFFCVILYVVCAGWADPGNFHNLRIKRAFSSPWRYRAGRKDKRLPAFVAAIFAPLLVIARQYTH